MRVLNPKTIRHKLLQNKPSQPPLSTLYERQISTLELRQGPSL
ncbi:hypothetical protein PORCRE_1202 [Porphyromonas crevioricanis JCM 15906]|uniref:Uncharacterized protein n=1 Tax=Porphyromonas crevioricanis JCM 15906 TaxID=1305617 RepID=T1DSY8_9PORP|nr:hypothetical protein PORCRE_1202 [Porphyromonas crevioricanis JCM 15906]